MKTNYQKNYNTGNRQVQLKLDEYFADKIIPENDSVRLLEQIIEEMDHTQLFGAFKRTGRPPVINPVTMMKILIYASMEGNYTSRKIATSCKRDINYIFLLNGEKAPSYSAIARFRSNRLPEFAEDYFYQLVKKLNVLGEIEYEHLFIDGTKIEANANRYTYVWKKSVTRNESNLLAKLEILRNELSIKYLVNTKSAEELLSELESRVDFPFVHGVGRRKSSLQKDIEQLRSKLSKKEEYSKHQKTFKERSSYSKTDPDATFMRMKEDHMHNSQLKPGYNVQLGVEGEYITGIRVSDDRNDQPALIPLIDNMESNLKVRYTTITTDAGYESEENYTYLEKKKITSYIKPANYEKSKTKKYKNNIALRENMPYDPELDEYTCKAERKLKVNSTGTRESKTGFKSEITFYKCESCLDCTYKKNCTKAKGDKIIEVSKKFIEQRKKSLENITSEKGIQLRTNRSIQVEGAFGVIKQDYGFRRFLLRGHKKVSVEIILVAIGYNINKFHNKIQKGRTGKQLFEKKTA